ncbi:hypothetical protein SNEBB_011203 [Seison nebaliae]|nr:hypothetical protein SNEBB_011203 [Seison nebaliae]
MFGLQSYLSSLVARLIDKYVKLRASDFNLYWWGSDIVLHQLDMRMPTLQAMAGNLPLHFISGKVGELRVNVSWNGMNSNRLKITATNIEIRCELKYSKLVNVSSNEEDGEEKDGRTKPFDMKLDEENLMMDSTPSSMNDNKSYVQKMLSNILENIQLELRNVIFKFQHENDIYTLRLSSLSSSSMELKRLFNQLPINVNEMLMGRKTIISQLSLFINDDCICEKLEMEIIFSLFNLFVNNICMIDIHIKSTSTNCVHLKMNIEHLFQLYSLLNHILFAYSTCRLDKVLTKKSLNFLLNLCQVEKNPHVLLDHLTELLKMITKNKEKVEETIHNIALSPFRTVNCRKMHKIKSNSSIGENSDSSTVSSSFFSYLYNYLLNEPETNEKDEKIIDRYSKDEMIVIINMEIDEIFLNIRRRDIVGNYGGGIRLIDEMRRKSTDFISINLSRFAMAFANTSSSMEFEISFNQFTVRDEINNRLIMKTREMKSFNSLRLLSGENVDLESYPLRHYLVANSVKCVLLDDIPGIVIQYKSDELKEFVTNFNNLLIYIDVNLFELFSIFKFPFRTLMERTRRLNDMEEMWKEIEKMIFGGNKMVKVEELYNCLMETNMNLNEDETDLNLLKCLSKFRCLFFNVQFEFEWNQSILIDRISYDSSKLESIHHLIDIAISLFKRQIIRSVPTHSTIPQQQHGRTVPGSIEMTMERNDDKLSHEQLNRLIGLTNINHQVKINRISLLGKEKNLEIILGNFFLATSQSVYNDKWNLILHNCRYDNLLILNNYQFKFYDFQLTFDRIININFIQFIFRLLAMMEIERTENRLSSSIVANRMQHKFKWKEIGRKKCPLGMMRRRSSCSKMDVKKRSFPDGKLKKSGSLDLHGNEEKNDLEKLEKEKQLNLPLSFHVLFQQLLKLRETENDLTNFFKNQNGLFMEFEIILKKIIQSIPSFRIQFKFLRLSYHLIDDGLILNNLQSFEFALSPLFLFNNKNNRVIFQIQSGDFYQVANRLFESSINQSSVQMKEEENKYFANSIFLNYNRKMKNSNGIYPFLFFHMNRMKLNLDEKLLDSFQLIFTKLIATIMDVKEKMINLIEGNLMSQLDKRECVNDTTDIIFDDILEEYLNWEFKNIFVVHSISSQQSSNKEELKEEMFISNEIIRKLIFWCQCDGIAFKFNYTYQITLLSFENEGIGRNSIDYQSPFIFLSSMKIQRKIFHHKNEEKTMHLILKEFYESFNFSSQTRLDLEKWKNWQSSTSKNFYLNLAENKCVTKPVSISSIWFHGDLTKDVISSQLVVSSTQLSWDKKSTTYLDVEKICLIFKFFHKFSSICTVMMKMMKWRKVEKRRKMKEKNLIIDIKFKFLQPNWLRFTRQFYKNFYALDDKIRGKFPLTKLIDDLLDFQETRIPFKNQTIVPMTDDDNLDDELRSDFHQRFVLLTVVTILYMKNIDVEINETSLILRFHSIQLFHQTRPGNEVRLINHVKDFIQFEFGNDFIKLSTDCENIGDLTIDIPPLLIYSFKPYFMEFDHFESDWKKKKPMKKRKISVIDEKSKKRKNRSESPLNSHLHRQLNIYNRFKQITFEHLISSLYELIFHFFQSSLSVPIGSTEIITSPPPDQIQISIDDFWKKIEQSTHLAVNWEVNWKMNDNNIIQIDNGNYSSESEFEFDDNSIDPSKSASESEKSCEKINEKRSVQILNFKFHPYKSNESNGIKMEFEIFSPTHFTMGWTDRKEIMYRLVEKGFVRHRLEFGRMSWNSEKFIMEKFYYSVANYEDMRKNEDIPDQRFDEEPPVIIVEPMKVMENVDVIIGMEGNKITIEEKEFVIDLQENYFIRYIRPLMKSWKKWNDLFERICHRKEGIEKINGKIPEIHLCIKSVVRIRFLNLEEQILSIGLEGIYLKSFPDNSIKLMLNRFHHSFTNAQCKVGSVPYLFVEYRSTDEIDTCEMDVRAIDNFEFTNKQIWKLEKFFLQFLNWKKKENKKIENKKKKNFHLTIQLHMSISIGYRFLEYDYDVYYNLSFLALRATFRQMIATDNSSLFSKELLVEVTDLNFWMKEKYRQFHHIIEPIHRIMLKVKKQMGLTTNNLNNFHLPLEIIVNIPSPVNIHLSFWDLKTLIFILISHQEKFNRQIYDRALSSVDFHTLLLIWSTIRFPVMQLDTKIRTVLNYDKKSSLLRHDMEDENEMKWRKENRNKFKKFIISDDIRQLMTIQKMTLNAHTFDEGKKMIDNLMPNKKNEVFCIDMFVRNESAYHGAIVWKYKEIRRLNSMHVTSPIFNEKKKTKEMMELEENKFSSFSFFSSIICQSTRSPSKNSNIIKNETNKIRSKSCCVRSSPTNRVSIKIQYWNLSTNEWSTITSLSSIQILEGSRSITHLDTDESSTIWRVIWNHRDITSNNYLTSSSLLAGLNMSSLQTNISANPNRSNNSLSFVMVMPEKLSITIDDNLNGLIVPFFKFSLSELDLKYSYHHPPLAPIQEECQLNGNFQISYRELDFLQSIPLFSGNSILPIDIRFNRTKNDILFVLSLDKSIDIHLSQRLFHTINYVMASLTIFDLSVKDHCRTYLQIVNELGNERIVLRQINNDHHKFELGEKTRKNFYWTKMDERLYLEFGTRQFNEKNEEIKWNENIFIKPFNDRLMKNKSFPQITRYEKGKNDFLEIDHYFFQFHRNDNSLFQELHINGNIFIHNYIQFKFNIQLQNERNFASPLMSIPNNSRQSLRFVDLGNILILTISHSSSINQQCLPFVIDKNNLKAQIQLAIFQGNDEKNNYIAFRCHFEKISKKDNLFLICFLPILLVYSPFNSIKFSMDHLPLRKPSFSSYYQIVNFTNDSIHLLSPLLKRCEEKYEENEQLEFSINFHFDGNVNIRRTFQFDFHQSIIDKYASEKNLLQNLQEWYAIFECKTDEEISRKFNRFSIDSLQFQSMTRRKGSLSQLIIEMTPKYLLENDLTRGIDLKIDQIHQYSSNLITTDEYIDPSIFTTTISSNESYLFDGGSLNDVENCQLKFSLFDKLERTPSKTSNSVINTSTDCDTTTTTTITTTTSFRKKNIPKIFYESISNNNPSILDDMEKKIENFLQDDSSVVLAMISEKLMMNSHIDLHIKEFNCLKVFSVSLRPYQLTNGKVIGQFRISSKFKFKNLIDRRMKIIFYYGMTNISSMNERTPIPIGKNDENSTYFILDRNETRNIDRIFRIPSKSDNDDKNDDFIPFNSKELFCVCSVELEKDVWSLPSQPIRVIKTMGSVTMVQIPFPLTNPLYEKRMIIINQSTNRVTGKHQLEIQFSLRNNIILQNETFNDFLIMTDNHKEFLNEEFRSELNLLKDERKFFYHLPAMHQLAITAVERHTRRQNENGIDEVEFINLAHLWCPIERPVIRDEIFYLEPNTTNDMETKEHQNQELFNYFHYVFHSYSRCIVRWPIPGAISLRSDHSQIMTFVMKQFNSPSSISSYLGNWMTSKKMNDKKIELENNKRIEKKIEANILRQNDMIRIRLKSFELSHRYQYMSPEQFNKHQRQTELSLGDEAFFTQSELEDESMKKKKKKLKKVTEENLKSNLSISIIGRQINIFIHDDSILISRRLLHQSNVEDVNIEFYERTDSINSLGTLSQLSDSVPKRNMDRLNRMKKIGLFTLCSINLSFVELIMNRHLEKLNESSEEHYVVALRLHNMIINDLTKSVPTTIFCPDWDSLNEQLMTKYEPEKTDTSLHHEIMGKAILFSTSVSWISHRISLNQSADTLINKIMLMTGLPIIDIFLKEEWINHLTILLRQFIQTNDNLNLNNFNRIIENKLNFSVRLLVCDEVKLDKMNFRLTFVPSLTLSSNRLHRLLSINRAPISFNAVHYLELRRVIRMNEEKRSMLNISAFHDIYHLKEHWSTICRNATFIFGTVECFGSPLLFVSHLYRGVNQLVSIPTNFVRSRPTSVTNVVEGLAEGFHQLLVECATGSLLSLASFSSALSRLLGRQVSLQPTTHAIIMNDMEDQDDDDDDDDLNENDDQILSSNLHSRLITSFIGAFLHVMATPSNMLADFSENNQRILYESGLLSSPTTTMKFIHNSYIPPIKSQIFLRTHGIVYFRDDVNLHIYDEKNNEIMENDDLECIVTLNNIKLVSHISNNFIEASMKKKKTVQFIRANRGGVCGFVAGKKTIRIQLTEKQMQRMMDAVRFTRELRVIQNQ